jgi:hypothetical protein
LHGPGYGWNFARFVNSTAALEIINNQNRHAPATTGSPSLFKSYGHPVDYLLRRIKRLADQPWRIMSK